MSKYYVLQFADEHDLPNISMVFDSYSEATKALSNNDKLFKEIIVKEVDGELESELEEEESLRLCDECGKKTLQLNYSGAECLNPKCFYLGCL